MSSRFVIPMFGTENMRMSVVMMGTFAVKFGMMMGSSSLTDKWIGKMDNKCSATRWM